MDYFQKGHKKYFRCPYEMSMDEKNVRCIMGITQEAIRILRFHKLRFVKKAPGQMTGRW